MDANPFASSLDAAALAHGERPYLIPMDGDSVSFAVFRDRCLDWAAGLRELGAQFGDRIALLMDNRSEYVQAWYGCQLLGATVVSLNPMLPEDSQRYLLRLTAPRFCVVALSASAPQSSATLAAEFYGMTEIGLVAFAGRKKESLRRRGENVVPEDIERGVLSLSDVEQCAAVGVPSPHGDDDIRLCLVLAAGHSGVAGPRQTVSPGQSAGPGDAVGFPDAAMASLAERICAALPVTMRPSYLTVHDSLPYTSTSKVQRTKLRNCQLPRWHVHADRWLAGARETTP